MKKLLNAIVYLAAFAIATPVLASFQTIVRDCGPYHHEIQPIINGTIFRVRDGQRVRELYYPSRSFTVIPGCQGNKIAITENFGGKYSQSTEVNLLNPEGSELKMEKGFSAGGGTSTGFPYRRVLTINGITQAQGLLVRINPSDALPPPATVSISYLQNGVVTRELPHVSNPNALPWPNTTATMVYAATYYFDGQDIYAYEQMYERYGYNSLYQNWMNRWSKLLPNGTYAPVSSPQFGETQIVGDFPAEPLVQILNKARLANQSDALNDRSYYVFGTYGNVVKKIAPKSWGTTFGERQLKCGNAKYTLYRKQLMEANFSTSTYPAVQYMIERTEGTNRRLIPIPHVDQSWKLRRTPDNQSWEPGERSLWYVALDGCVGSNAAVNATYYGRGTLPSGQPVSETYTRGALVTANTSFIDYFNNSKSIGETKEEPYKILTTHPQGITIYGTLEKWGGQVSGDATLTELKANGSIVRTKPPYFRDIRQLPNGTTMRFTRHPVTSQFVVELAVPDQDYRSIDGTYNTQVKWTYELYVHENGAYRLIPERSYAYQLAPTDTTRVAKSIFVSKEPTFLAFRSYFLTRVTQLHGLGGKPYTLDWYRIGALEPNGSFKVWYAFTVDGRQQTWLTTVR